MTKDQFLKLQDDLIKHARLYYLEDISTIPDEEYDQMFRRMQTAKDLYPQLLLPNNPVLTVGGALAKYLDPVPHQHPMLSLGNLFNKTELDYWLKRAPSKLYYCDAKMDGLALSLIYEFGVFKQALTRGDGKNGEDVTHTAKGILNLPMSIPALVGVPRFEVRGEAVMSRAAFKAYNRKNKKKPLVNCRNGVAGAIRTLKTDQVIKRGVMFFAYGVGGTPLEISVSAQQDTLSKWGFDIPWGGVFMAEEIQAKYEELQNKRDDLEYDIDGFVIKVNNYEEQDKLGFITREPKFATAYKFPAASAWTPMIDVIYQVGRTGVVTPKAKVESVFVGGVTYDYVTLHNAAEMARLQLRKNSNVLIERRGDVIPKIMKCEDGDELFVFPEHCPCCSSRLVRMGNIMEFCQNPSCGDQLLFRLSHAVSRLALNIKGLSEKRIQALIDTHGTINIADILDGTPEFFEVAGIGKKDSVKLSEAATEAQKTSLARYIYSLGIKEVGESTAALLAATYKSMDGLMRAEIPELRELPDVGEVIARNIHTFMNSEHFKNLHWRLIDIGLELEHKTSNLEKKLDCKSVCVTGSFGRMGRSDIKQLIRDLGGNPTGGVSKKTDLLIAGSGAGSKLQKAMGFGIEIMDEDQFFNFIGG